MAALAALSPDETADELRLSGQTLKLTSTSLSWGSGQRPRATGGLQGIGEAPLLNRQ